MNTFTDYFPPPELTDQLVVIDTQQASIQSRDKDDTNLWTAIQKKLRVEWTYHSNAIEGSSLSRGETQFFLEEGLTVEGKPLKDFLDAKNHGEAIDHMMALIKEDSVEITEGVIKSLNALLLKGVEHTPAIDKDEQAVRKPAHPGDYKQQPNHVLQADGSIHRYVDPLQVGPQMAELCAWIARASVHPVIVAAVAHYNLVRIHPFDDGNGRVSRLIMNMILMKAGYVPAVIAIEQRRAYLEALQNADSGDVDPFVRIIVSALDATQKTVLSDLQL